LSGLTSSRQPRKKRPGVSRNRMSRTAVQETKMERLLVGEVGLHQGVRAATHVQLPESYPEVGSYEIGVLLGHRARLGPQLPDLDPLRFARSSHQDRRGHRSE